MYLFLLVINVAVAIIMVGVILLQHGRGAEMGTSFGRGSQGSLVGVTGSSNFLSRTTAILATIFFVSALALGILTKTDDSDEVLEGLRESEAPAYVEGAQVPTEGNADTVPEPDVVPVAPDEYPYEE